MAELGAGPAPAGFDIRRILLLGGVIAVILIAIIVFFVRGCLPAARGVGGYTVIYSNLDLRDAANAIARLKELGVEYEIREDGHALAVPKDKADEARLGLAEKNLPAGGVVGWEIFDESKLGATDFDRRIQLIRAISGELSRTIRRIDGVEDARVQIVLPETRLFAEKVAPVTASVMLRLKLGVEISPAKINGIVHLVASSVENLQPENVTVIDDTGKILTLNKPASPLATISELTEKLVPQPAQAAAVEMASPEVVLVQSTEVQSLEAAGVVVPSQLSEEEKALLVVQAKKGLEADLSGKAQEILNRFYPPNSAIIKVNIDFSGFSDFSKPVDFNQDKLKVKKITAIILIDNRVELGQDLKTATFKAVAAAIGYSRKRGDLIVLQKVPFHLATPPPDIVKAQVEKALPPKPAPARPVFPGWIFKAFWLIVVLGLISLVALFVRKRRSPTAPAQKMVERSPGEREGAASARKSSAIDNVKTAVEKNPERIAEMLKKWLSE